MLAKEMWRLIALSVVLFSTPTMAVSITEGLDYVDGANPNIGVVDVGITTVSGSINGECAGPGLPFICTFGAGPGADPLDRFTFDVAAGAAVIGIDFDLTNVVLAPAGFSMEIDIDGFATFSGLSPGVYSALGLPPLTDPVTLSIGGDESTLSGPFIVDWTVTIEAVAVSAPAPLLLMTFAAGWILLPMGQRRHHN